MQTMHVKYTLVLFSCRVRLYLVARTAITLRSVVTLSSGLGPGRPSKLFDQSLNPITMPLTHCISAQLPQRLNCTVSSSCCKGSLATKACVQDTSAQLRPRSGPWYQL